MAASTRCAVEATRCYSLRSSATQDLVDLEHASLQKAQYMYHIHFIRIAIQMWFARVVGALTLKNHLIFAEAEIPVVCGSEWLARGFCTNGLTKHMGGR